jgi:glutamyl/glutaminyl-tRNA synthetase
LESAGLWADDYLSGKRQWFLAVIELLKPRSRTLVDFLTDGRPSFDTSDDFAYDPSAERKYLKADGLTSHLRTLRDRLAAVLEWDAARLEEMFRAVADERGIAASALIHPARLAVTGKGVSPGLFDVLVLLGKERTLARLDRLIEHVSVRSAS